MFHRSLALAFVAAATGLLAVEPSLPAPTAAAATGEAQVMIVLDASGSMWGRLEGKTRIEVARAVLRDLMANWDPAIQVGLVAYGHRRKDDCADIETLVPVGPGRPPARLQSIVAAADALQPKGMTPLSEAVRRAAQELRYTEKRATVVLVSDGVETCKADPCKVGTELAKTGVGFTAHVIGFGVTTAEQAGLRCLAKNTGGMFLAATDAASLRAALGKTVEQAKQAPLPVVEKPGPAKVQPPASAVAGSRFEVRWQGPNSRGDYVTVVRAGAPGAEFGDYAYTVAGNPLKLTAPDEPGGYEVRYIFSSTAAVLALAPIRVDAATATLAGPATIPAGGMLAVRWTGPNNQGDYVTVVKVGAEEGQFLNYAYTSGGSPASFQAPDEPGNYELRYVSGQSNRTLARAAIAVTAASASVSGPASATAGQLISIAWKGPNNPGDYVAIAPAGADESQYGNYAYTSGGSPVSFQTPDEPGAYELRYFAGQTNRILARAPITVTVATASVTPPAAVGAGQRFSVSWKGPNNPGDYIAIAETGAEDGRYLNYAYTSGGSPAQIDAPEQPGNYEIRYYTGQTNKVLARGAITVR